MKQKYIIAIVLFTIVVIAVIATTLALVLPKNKTESFVPILTLSCGDCIKNIKKGSDCPVCRSTSTMYIRVFYS